MANPILSIIIPVYNAETYIEECLNSIVKQSYSNIEIIIIKIRKKWEKGRNYFAVKSNITIV